LSKTPWLVTAASVLITLFLGVSNYVARVGVANTPRWLRPIAEWLSGLIGSDPGLWVFVFVTLGALVTVADRVWGAQRFKKAKIQRVLDHAVAEILSGDAKTHRLTLFKAVRGWRAWLSVLGNRLWRQDE